MSVALTKSRFINTLKCYGNYALSRIGLVRISHMPAFVNVEPTAICQLRCPECPVGMGKGDRSEVKGKRTMPRAVWERVMKEVAPYAHTMQFYFQGEPLLNKDLPQMIAEAHEAGLYTIVSTNGQAMTEKMAELLIRAGLNKIIVSMDGLTKVSYEAYRVGGDIEKCKDALRFLHEAKQRLHGRTTIELQCLRLRTNEQEWTAFRRQYKALGADRLAFKTAQLYTYENGHPLMPTNNRHCRYEKGKDGLYHRKKLSRGCLRVWSGVVVTTNGEVLPCCYDKAHEHSYGNIMEKPLAELFASEKARAFRQAALKEQPQICKECWK